MARRSKLDRYRAMRDQIAELVRKTDDATSRRATAVAILHHKLRAASWTGFYMLRDGSLNVDIYQGPVACLVLEPHAGVCWAAIDRRKPVIVPDVHAFPGHIACDSSSRSEIVVPHVGESGEVIGVLDIDSHRPDAFDDEDREGLELVVAMLEGR